MEGKNVRSLDESLCCPPDTSGNMVQVESLNQQLDESLCCPPDTSGNMVQVESLNQQVDEMVMKVKQLERDLNDVEQFYSCSSTRNPSTPKGPSGLKNKDRNNFKKRQQDAVHREAAATKRMQELMRQFRMILENITEHKWAKPFLQPVDVVGLGLRDYYEVIEKPMDFSTVKSKMESKDGTGYKNVREICADVRLIFKNAMKYNDEKHDVHIMAKSLLDRFESKWLQFLPKVDEEERRLKYEKAEMKKDLLLAQEIAYAKMAREISIELEEVDSHLEKLKGMPLLKCRKLTTEEKKQLGSAITKLSPEDINKALDIVAQEDPNFQASGETIEVNIDVQSESTLWKLKFFVKETLQSQMNTQTGVNGNHSNTENNQSNSNKRKREICDAIGKNSQKKTKKLPG